MGRGWALNGVEWGAGWSYGTGFGRGCEPVCVRGRSVGGGVGWRWGWGWHATTGEGFDVYLLLIVGEKITNISNGGGGGAIIEITA